MLKRYDLEQTARVFGEIVKSARQEGKTRTKCEWLYEIIQSQAYPRALSTEDLNVYVGDYGPRHIDTDGNALFYYVDPGYKIRLYPISGDEFSFEDQFHRRAEFEKGGGGKVEAIVIHYYRDTSEKSPRDR